ncbi:hypothetical protein Vretimale_14159 [Volvox reticuliferus]|nr:hypothetical protein Vretimale_14159 [Volvox reticuliferus]
MPHVRALSPLLPRSSAAQSAVLTVLALIIALAPDVAQGSRQTYIDMACLDVRGYETIASSTSFSWGGQSYPSTKLARAACTSDPNCAGFDSAGYTLPVGSLKLIMDKTYFDCNYLKAGETNKCTFHPSFAV